MELKKYLEIIWRRKWIFIQAVLFIPLFTYLLFKIIPPVYQSQAKLWVKVSSLPQQFLTNMPSKWGQLEFTSSDNAMGTIDGLLRSAVVNRVIKEMNLRNKDGDLFHPDDFTNPKTFMLPLQKKGVYIKQITDAEVFEIRGYSNELAEAEMIADNVTKVFLASFSERYKSQARETKTALVPQFEDVKKRLIAAERTLEKYRTANKVFDVSEQTKSLIAEIAKLKSEKKSTSKRIWRA